MLLQFDDDELGTIVNHMVELRWAYPLVATGALAFTCKLLRSKVMRQLAANKYLYKLVRSHALQATYDLLRRRVLIAHHPHEAMLVARSLVVQMRDRDDHAWVRGEASSRSTGPSPGPSCAGRARSGPRSPSP